MIVDFTTPSSVMDNLMWCIDNGLNCVVGTSGFDEDRLGQVRSWVAGGHRSRVLIAPNFSVGAVLMMHFAQQAAPVLRVGRGGGVAPSGQGRRPVGHRAAHRLADRGGPDGGRPGSAAGRHRDRAPRRPRRGRQRRARARGAAGWPDRAPGGAARRARRNRSPSGTTRSTGRRSCRACYWPCATSGRCRPASPSASSPCSASAESAAASAEPGPPRRGRGQLSRSRCPPAVASSCL